MIRPPIRNLLLMGALVASLGGSARAADRFSDADLHLSADPPDGFVKAPELPKDQFLGTPKALWISPDLASNGGAWLVHDMPIPGGLDYAAFKTGFGAILESLVLKLKIVKQEDVTVGKLTGFSLEITAPGDGTKIDPNGTIPHHVRWYFLKKDDNNVIGILYGA
jgi:hypothetical protein